MPIARNVLLTPGTVENVMMHMVIMHISENASGPGGNGARPVHL